MENPSSQNPCARGNNDDDKESNFIFISASTASQSLGNYLADTDTDKESSAHFTLREVFMRLRRKTRELASAYRVLIECFVACVNDEGRLWQPLPSAATSQTCNVLNSTDNLSLRLDGKGAVHMNSLLEELSLTSSSC